MGKLSNPSRELAQRLLTEVEFADRIKGFRFREHVGPLSMIMYSFKEVYNFLNDPYPRLDFARLEEWFRDAYEDKELADRLAQIRQTSESNQDIGDRIRDLMGQRLTQAKDLLNVT